MANAPIDWRQKTNAIDYSQPQGSQQGSVNYMTDARNKGYTGTFVLPQNYADEYGKNFGQASMILQSGFSGQNPQDKQTQDMYRSILEQRLGGLNNNAEQNWQANKAELEKGFSNNLAMLRRNAAGTGAGASLGYGRSAGDLSSQFMQDLAKARLDTQNNAANELSQLGQGQNMLNAQDMAAAQQQYGQAQDLSNLYMQMANTESGRSNTAAEQSFQDTQARKAAQSALISSILGTGAMLGSSAIQNLKGAKNQSGGGVT